MPRGVYTRKTKASAKQEQDTNTMSQTDEREITIAPAIIRKSVDVTDEQIEGRERVVAVDGPQEIEVVPAKMLNMTALENERFMAEMVKIFLHEPVAEHEEKLAWVGVNEDRLWLERGKEYTLKRYHIAVLAQAKHGRVSQRKHVAPDGAQSFINIETSMLRYPFSVIDDTSRGRQWLAQIMRQPA